VSAILRYPNAFIPLKEQAINKDSQQQSISLQKVVSQAKLSLDVYVLTKQAQAATKNTFSTRIAGLSLALLCHLLALYWVVNLQDKPEVLLNRATPITVSIIAPPVPEIKPEPEILPVIEPVKVEKKPIIKPKKVVEKIVPVETPTQPVFEATTQPVEEKKEPVQEVATPAVVEKATPKAAPVEEKLELPKFGVAYLNNPAPDYPGMAKRAGEQGRVLLKVLVSAEGAAESVDLEKSSGFERLDNAAKDAVSRWRFIPARKGGQALGAYVIVPIKFSLDD
jgi:periplasmic protein TonB